MHVYFGMQERLTITIDTPAGSGPLTLRCFDHGPRQGFANTNKQRAANLGINLCVAGDGFFHDETHKIRYDLTPGDVFIRHPDIVHSTRVSKDYGELSIGFSNCHLPALSQLGLLPLDMFISGNMWAGAISTMQSLMERTRNAATGDPSLLLQPHTCLGNG